MTCPTCLDTGVITRPPLGDDEPGVGAWMVFGGEMPCPDCGCWTEKENDDEDAEPRCDV